MHLRMYHRFQWLYYSKINDIIELCKTKNNSIIGWAIEKNIDKLLQSKEIFEFFNTLLNEFQYKYDIIQLSYKSILRVKKL